MSAPSSPAQAVALLSTGQPVLRCDDACLPAWQRAQPEAARLNAAGRWPELGALLLNVGYRDDLSLYYLGRAAEGLNYKSAADSYYGQSAFMSRSVAACNRKSRMCGGVDLPAAALQRRAAIDRQLAGAARGGGRFTVRHAPAAPAEPAAGAEEPAVNSSAPSSPPEPLPAAAHLDRPEPFFPIAPPQPPSRIPANTGGRDAGAADFIEPPAAR